MVGIYLIKSKVSPDGILQEETTNTVKNRPKSYTISMKDKYDLDKVKGFSREISGKVLRFKGFFESAEGVICHADCVGDYIKIEVLKNKPHGFIADLGQLIFAEPNDILPGQMIRAAGRAEQAAHDVQQCRLS